MYPQCEFITTYSFYTGNFSINSTTTTAALITTTILPYVAISITSGLTEYIARKAWNFGTW